MIMRYLYIQNKSENHKYVWKEGDIQLIIIKYRYEIIEGMDQVTSNLF